MFKKLLLVFLCGGSITAQAESVLPISDISINDSIETISVEDIFIVGKPLERIILDWSRFNIGEKAIVNYNEPDTNSLTLNKFIPAGYVNKGITDSNLTLGDIQISSRGNIQVNQNRFKIATNNNTYAGSLLLWSTIGTIDSGTGIRAVVYDPSIPDNDIILLAPNGTIDAGDAGVTSSGTLIIATSAVPLPLSIYLFLSALGCLSFYKKKNY